MSKINQQQDSWVDRFENEFDYLYEKDEVKSFISTERQRVIEEVRGLVEGKKRDVRLKDGCGFCKSTDEKPCNCDPWNSALDDLLQALKEMEDKTL